MMKQPKIRRALLKRSDRNFTGAQQDFLKRAIAQGINADQIDVIRQGFWSGLSIEQVSVFTHQALDWKQMAQMRYCFKDGWEIDEVQNLVIQNCSASTISNMRIEWARRSPEQRQAEREKILLTAERKRIEEEEKQAKDQRALLELQHEENRKNIKLEALKRKKEREEQQRLERERIVAEEAARVERERIAAEEAARIERERIVAEEAARVERERIAAEEAARVEHERIAAEEAARIERERITQEEEQQRNIYEQKITKIKLAEKELEERKQKLIEVERMVEQKIQAAKQQAEKIEKNVLKKVQKQQKALDSAKRPRSIAWINFFTVLVDNLTWVLAIIGGTIVINLIINPRFADTVRSWFGG